MSTASPLLDPRTLAQVKDLSIQVQRVVDGVLQGMHRSPHRGSSVEFAGHKEYCAGDDVRHIDWRAYARLDKVYVKTFEHETNLRAWFVLDESASMAYGAEGTLSKHRYASIMLATLAFLLLRQQDTTALITFADAVRTVVPVGGQMVQLGRVCEALDSVSPRGETRLEVGLERLAETAVKRGLIFVFSDFFGDAERCLSLLRQLVSKGHTVTVFHVLDGDELTFPFEGMVHFEGLETKRRLLVEPRLVRDTYLARLEAHREALRRRCLEARVRHVSVDTREALDGLLTRVIGSREVRAGRGAR